MALPPDAVVLGAGRITPPAAPADPRPVLAPPSRQASWRWYYARRWWPGSAIAQAPGASDTDALVRHAARAEAALGEPLTPGNRLQLLIDGPDTYAAMFAAVDAARDHVHIESYIVEAEGPGEALARRLIERRAAGVQVGLLYDGFGSLQTGARYFEALRATGVRLCEYRPLAPWRRRFDRRMHLRDHRKLLLVDGQVAFIGGVNISRVYSAGSTGGSAPVATADAGATRWRDTHLRIEGPVVARLQQLFIRHWDAQHGSALPPARHFPPLAPAGTQRVGVAACDAGRRRNPFYRALLAAIDGAHERVWVTVAYFVPPRRLVRALVRAARRGVDVRLLLPGVSDAWAPLHAGRASYGRLLAAGVRIHELHDVLLHAKTTVIDGVWSTVGSSNWDWRSFLHNAEANVVVVDAAFGRSLEAVYRRDLEGAREVTLAEWRSRSRVQRLREWVARRVEFFL